MIMALRLKVSWKSTGFSGVSKLKGLDEGMSCLLLITPKGSFR